MPSKKRTVEVQIVVDDDKARRDLDRIADSTTKTAKSFSNMGTLVKAGLAAFGAQEMLQALGKLDKLNQQMQANEVRADTVFASMADDARTWADEQNEAFGIGENALLGLASNMQDLLVPMGFARDEAFGLTKEALTLANALDDWKGGTLGVDNATDRIIKSMLGEREGLVELGIKISDAQVKTRLLEKGQQDLTGTALEQATATATLELITEKSADALELYADRAGTAAARNKELKASTEDVGEDLAEAWGPAIESGKSWLAIAGQFAGVLVEDFTDMADAIIQDGDAMEDATGPAHDLEWELKQLHGQQQNVAGSADDAAGEIDNMGDAMLAAVDPAFDLLRRHEKFVTSQQKYNEAVAEFGPNSAQARAAQVDLLESAGGYVAAQENFTELTPEMEEAFRRLAEKAGIYGGDLEDILAFLGAIDRTTRGLPSLPSSGNVSPSGVRRYHQGGEVAGTPGSEQLAVLQAGETVIPRSGGTGRGRGGLTTINNIHVSDPSPILIRQLLEIGRRG